jgi:hypothetical protein
VSDNQEMQFADPAWQPGTAQESGQEQVPPAPQPAWIPPPELEAATSTDEPEQTYSQGYRAQNTQAPGYDSSFQGQQQPFFQPQQPRQGHVPPWVWVLIVIVLLSGGPFFSFGNGGHIIGALWTLFVLFVLWLLFTRRMRVSLSGDAQPAETRTFEVGPRPTIVINNKAGSVRLRAGQEGQVSITTTKRGFLFSQRWDQDSQVWYNQDQDSNTVSARVDNWRPFGRNAIDFDVVVPPQASLELITNAGVVSVENVAGQMKLQSDAGTITAAQVTLSGRSRLKTNAGTIAFSGSIDPAGDYELTTDLGTIDVTLPADASFALDARTDLGTVSTNFPITRPQKNKAYGQVGIGPYPRLKVKTDLGTVKVTRG